MSAVFGDEQLAARAAGLLGSRHPRFAVATVTATTTTVASRGAELGADFEIASISKGLTGLLYADALARGEIRRDSTLGELLPLAGTPVAGVTLDSLSTHRSGLPGLPRSARPLRRTIALWRSRRAVFASVRLGLATPTSASNCWATRSPARLE